jgi:hypothetical protein
MVMFWGGPEKHESGLFGLQNKFTICLILRTSFL